MSMARLRQSAGPDEQIRRSTATRRRVIQGAKTKDRRAVARRSLRDPTSMSRVSVMTPAIIVGSFEDL
jgi:hypothetical protein